MGVFFYGGRRSFEQVYAFEQNGDNVQLINQSASVNGYSNLTTITGTVGETIQLSEHPVPDVVLMDIEGWELTALEQAKAVLQHDAVWIVEVHTPAMLGEDAPDNDPDEIRNLFEEFDYYVKKINEGRGDNYHLLAVPDAG